MGSMTTVGWGKGWQEPAPGDPHALQTAQHTANGGDRFPPEQRLSGLLNQPQHHCRTHKQDNKQKQMLAEGALMMDDDLHIENNKRICMFMDYPRSGRNRQHRGVD